MNHHYPMGPEYYTTVLGYSLIIIICIWFFIHYLRVGLNSSDSVHIDSTEGAFAPNEKASGHHHH